MYWPSWPWCVGWLFSCFSIFDDPFWIIFLDTFGLPCSINLHSAVYLFDGSFLNHVWIYFRVSVGCIADGFRIVSTRRRHFAILRFVDILLVTTRPLQPCMEVFLIIVRSIPIQNGNWFAEGRAGEDGGPTPRSEEDHERGARNKQKQ